MSILVKNQDLFTNTNQYDNYLLKANILNKQGKPEAAKEALDFAIKAHQVNPETELALANIFITQGDYNIAKSILEEATNNFPDNPQLLLLQAKISEAFDELDMAEDQLSGCDLNLMCT